MLVKKASAMKVRQNLGDILNSVQYRQDSVLVSKGGKPVAAIIDVELFQKVLLFKKEFLRLSSELAETYDDTSEEEALAEIDEALKATRTEK